MYIYQVRGVLKKIQTNHQRKHFISLSSVHPLVSFCSNKSLENIYTDSDRSRAQFNGSDYRKQIICAITEAGNSVLMSSIFHGLARWQQIYKVKHRQFCARTFADHSSSKYSPKCQLCRSPQNNVSPTYEKQSDISDSILHFFLHEFYYMGLWQIICHTLGNSKLVATSVKVAHQSPRLNSQIDGNVLCHVCCQLQCSKSSHCLLQLSLKVKLDFSCFFRLYKAIFMFRLLMLF